VDRGHQPLGAVEFIARVRSWAEDQADVRGVVLVGSQARDDPGADEWSDVDVVIVSTDAERYLGSTDWLQEFGPFEITVVEGTAVGDYFERRVLFTSGLDVDVTVLTPSVLDAAMTIPEVADVRRRGFRVLVDKDEIVTRTERDLAPLAALELKLPTAVEFEHATSDFWYHTVWAAKKLARGERWVATRSVNCYLSELLLRALEWQARLVAERDTWHQGRFLERWAEPTAVIQLRDAFAPYEDDGVQRALAASMDLFRNLTVEIAHRLHFPYPADADRFASEYVADLRAAQS
jgi:aminoglycoside 6-adenylyltransferase